MTALFEKCEHDLAQCDGARRDRMITFHWAMLVVPYVQPLSQDPHADPSQEGLAENHQEADVDLVILNMVVNSWRFLFLFFLLQIDLVCVKHSTFHFRLSSCPDSTRRPMLLPSGSSSCCTSGLHPRYLYAALEAFCTVVSTPK